MYKKIYLSVIYAFLLLCILVWLDEILDLSHLLLQVPGNAINWSGKIFETVIIAAIGFFVILRVKRGITGHKRMEDKIRESEQKVNLLSEQSLLGIIIIQDDSIKYANRAFSGICEYSIEEILNWEIDDFMKIVNPEDKAFVMEQAKKRKAGNKDVVNHYKFHIIAKSGAIKWVEVYSKKILFNGRNAVMITSIDITEKKMAEVKAQIQQQLIESDRLASLGVLVAGVAHEINNPNQTIMSNASLILKTWKNITPILEEYYKENGDFVLGGLKYTEMRTEMPICLNGISHSAKRIGSIVDDLKNYARQDDYEITKDINMNLVVKSAITLVSNFITKSTKNLKVKFAEEIPRVIGNFQKLEQVMINLIQNACQSLPDRDKALFVKTHYDKSKQYIEVDVTDEGIGISPENLLKVKDPFFTTKRNSGGTGLGLSICSTIIKDHHGTLNIKSETGKGTTVTITLPVEDNTTKEELE